MGCPGEKMTSIVDENHPFSLFLCVIKGGKNHKGKNKLNLNYVNAKLGDEEVDFFVDNAEPNSCGFPFPVKNLSLELTFYLISKGFAKMLSA